MKRITSLFIVLFSVLLYPQVDFSVFPRIAYADLYWLHYQNLADYTSRAYYYPELEELGLTHSVSFTTSASLNVAADNNLKLIAKGFERDKFTLCKRSATYPLPIKIEYIPVHSVYQKC